MQDTREAGARGSRSYYFVCVAYACLFLLTATFWTIYISRQKSFLEYAYRTDFVGIYVGARMVAQGQGAHLYDLNVQRATMDQAVLPEHRSNLMAFVYPGYVAVLLQSLGRLSLRHAAVVMLVLNSALALWIAWLLIRLAGSVRDRLIILLAFFSFVPLHLTLLQNQLGLFAALGLVQAVLALRSNRPIRAGCWLLVGLLKPQLIAFPLLAFLLWRCWGVLGPFCAGVAAVIGLSISSLGWWVPHYLSFLSEYNHAGSGVSLFPVAMQNWRGLAFLLLGSESPAYWILFGVLTFASLAAVLFLCFRGKNREGANGASRFSSSAFSSSREFGFAAVMILGGLASPHLYMHDWVIFVPAAIILWQSLSRISDGSRGGNANSLLLILLAASPFIFWLGQFGPSFAPFQLVPWYIGVLATAVLVAVQRSSFAIPRTA